MEIRVRFIADPDPDLSWLEQEEFVGESADDFAILAIEVETECECCGAFTGRGASLWGITVYGYGGQFPRDEGLGFLHETGWGLGDWMSPADACVVPGYLGECVRDLIEEATA